MAVYTSITYGQPVDAGSQNDHTSYVIAPGIYKGMYIRPHSTEGFTLDVRNVPSGEDDKNSYRTDLVGIAIMPQGMRVKITAPQLYNEADDNLKRLRVDGPSEKDRIDLVYLEYAYKKVPFNQNMPRYGVVKGTPSDLPVRPDIFSEFEINDDAEDRRTIQINNLRSIRIPMAYVTVRHNATGLLDSDIVNVPRTLNANEMVKFIYEKFNELFGNVLTSRLTGFDGNYTSIESGFEVSASYDESTRDIDISIAEGTGLIGVIDGKVISSEGSSLKVTHDDLYGDGGSSILYYGFACSEGIAAAQPRVPSTLSIAFNFTAPVPANTVIASITGLWLEDGITRRKTVNVTAPGNFSSGEKYVYTFEHKICSIDPAGLDMTNIISENRPVVELTYYPCIYVIAYVHNDNMTFRFETDPNIVRNLPGNELVLGIVKTSMSGDGSISLVVS